ncbi:MAG TPA: biopolymer transporter ExbD [Thermoanaerobaculia bacterium]|nr:biopolymer transporter ExbD [Thermoanaerobaculia bacterium]
MQSPKQLVPREININPLVDLSLVLLILLVVVVPMLRRDPVPPPSRPRPAASAPQGRADHLAVEIGADGAIFIEQHRVQWEELPELLAALHDAGPNRQVMVQGDRRVRYSEVRQLMVELHHAGFQQVSFPYKKNPSPASGRGAEGSGM